MRVTLVYNPLRGGRAARGRATCSSNSRRRATTRAWSQAEEARAAAGGPGRAGRSRRRRRQRESGRAGPRGPGYPDGDPPDGHGEQHRQVVGRLGASASCRRLAAGQSPEAQDRNGFGRRRRHAVRRVDRSRPVRRARHPRRRRGARERRRPHGASDRPGPRAAPAHRRGAGAARSAG